MPDVTEQIRADLEMFVPLRMDSGEVAVEFMGQRVGSKDWLPEGCCGILFVFTDAASMRAFYGDDVPFSMLQAEASG